MRTLVISDLHIGARTGIDVLRHDTARTALLERLDGVERLVLLGDVLELRHGPPRIALAAARPLFEALGAALGDAQVVLVPGNHDHRLVAPWLERRGADAPPPPLRLEEHAGPDASEATATIAGWLAPASLDVAYPGVWLRDDVYATHGHYLDRHTTVPTFERLGAGIMGRVVGALPARGATPDHYEAALAPLYAWMDAMADRVAPGRSNAPPSPSANAWRMLAGDGHRPLRGRLLAGMLPIGVGTLNRLGLGPVKADLSAAELRRAGVRAMADVCAQLRIDAEHVIYGHTHRGGPFSFDDGLEWSLPDGGLLTNTGSWVYEPVFLRRGRASPYWPGIGVELGAEGPPVIVRMLADADVNELRPA